MVELRPLSDSSSGVCADRPFSPAMSVACTHNSNSGGMSTAGGARHRSGSSESGRDRGVCDGTQCSWVPGEVVAARE
jgi:hypothetical protein